eukprot:283956_1
MSAKYNMLYLSTISLLSLTVIILYQPSELSHDIIENIEYNETQPFPLLSSLSTMHATSSHIKLSFINLLNTKYNYTNITSKINIDNINPIEIPNQQSYQPEHCIARRKIQLNTPCQLNDNISVIIHNKIGSGIQANVFNVSLIHNNIYSEFLAMKVMRRIWHPCAEYETEYTLLTQMQQLSMHLNVPYLYSNNKNIPIPFYKAGKNCVLFTKLLINKLNWNNTLQTVSGAKKLLPLIISKKGNIIQFLIDCYTEIMNIIHILYQLGIYHNDLNEKNILIDKYSLKCYVIDLANMFHSNDISNKPRWSCMKTTCSPVCYYYLRRMRER